MIHSTIASYFWIYLWSYSPLNMTQPIPIPCSTAKARPTTSYQDKCEECGIQRVDNPYISCACWSKCKVRCRVSSQIGEQALYHVFGALTQSCRTCGKSTLTSHRELYQIWTGPLDRCVSIVVHSIRWTGLCCSDGVGLP